MIGEMMETKTTEKICSEKEQIEVGGVHKDNRKWTSANDDLILSGKKDYQKLTDEKLKEIQQLAQDDYNLAKENLQFANDEMNRRGFTF